MSSAGVGPLCFIKSKINAAIYQEILEYLMLPSADKYRHKACQQKEAWGTLK